MDKATRTAVETFLGRVGTLYPVAHALLYGSRARGDARPDSDADVAVILDGPAGNFWDIKFSLSDIAYDVFLESGVLIEALPIWQGEWLHPEAYTNPALLRNIRTEGIAL